MTDLVGRLDGAMVDRLVLTMRLCGLIGLERSAHERASGFRLHILVGVGASLMTQAGAYGFADLRLGNRDPMRVASYVVSGSGGGRLGRRHGCARAFHLHSVGAAEAAEMTCFEASDRRFNAAGRGSSSGVPICCPPLCRGQGR